MSRNNCAFKKRFSVASREAVPPLRNTFYNIPLHNKTLRGWSGGAMVLDKLPVPGRPNNLD